MKKSYSIHTFIVTQLLLVIVLQPAYASGSEITVSLCDNGANAMAMLKPGMMRDFGMKTEQLPPETMGIKIDSSSIGAGEITFQVTKDSTVMVHEMVVAPVEDEQRPLPCDQSQMKVDEGAAVHLGEVAELEPGKSGALTLQLKPGKYIF